MIGEDDELVSGSGAEDIAGELVYFYSAVMAAAVYYDAEDAPSASGEAADAGAVDVSCPGHDLSYSLVLEGTTHSVDASSVSW